jgi:hypothetical protein
MNRKDFDLVARIIKTSDNQPDRRRNMALDFAMGFDKAEGCSGFDRERFLKACGVKP